MKANRKQQKLTAPELKTKEDCAGKIMLLPLWTLLTTDDTGAVGTFVFKVVKDGVGST